ncbi:beta-mannosidase [Pelagibacterium luteolum]|uniref:beta-mannosidase n=1 Tax=Pelagibacterium luteolum TaxID=440168 RepID=A0A1G7TND9_9HYPH|nr:glycoside hydrolase family 2 protein [Pelagibacterium luteolum]SDG36199.1 beta-mannosidase [Pelagibacterium luteolum]
MPEIHAQDGSAIDYKALDLGGIWTLVAPERGWRGEITLPGDVHTALLEAGEIPDPYFGQNEDAVAWVYKTPWTVERKFDVPMEMANGFLTLTLSEVDCIASVSLNGEVIAHTQNQFIRYDIDVTGKVRPGANTLQIAFAAVPDVAQERADAHPFAIPYAAMNQKVAHLNFVRKTACHAGWDWGICVMPIGVYGRMELRRSPLARTESVQVDQHHEQGAVTLEIKTRVHAFGAGEISVEHVIDGQAVGGRVAVRPGENLFTHRIVMSDAQIWWPNGQGAQPLYELKTSVDGEVTLRKIGLRQLEWIVEKDAIDHSFKCRINGRDITMMGANWIPADAIPSRITPDAVRDLLESAKAANYNMLRVWGGGQYEPDWFYDLCDELGILIWHDFTFSCMPYPSDRVFLADVAIEVTQQVRRLSHHASIAIWCGDNEVIGSLNWYPETRANRDRHLANYDRMSKLLSDIVEDEDPQRRFWPSSPSLGYMDFADGWHIDTRGDMHFWDVWHSAKPFEHYRTVQPRFASEFGFQSFTSMNVIESFTEPGDRNPSSPVMETHQRNDGGNARILETMCRYFRFPKGFEEMVFLSQVQQGLAIKTAIEFWRSTKPRCMGTLYWQINDIWPVASWSSLDYGGQWKLLHYLAKRFFAPINVVAVPDGDTVVIKAMNDGPAPADITLEVVLADIAGPAKSLHRLDVSLGLESASELARVPLEDIGEGQFLVFEWRTKAGELIGRNDFLPRAYKYYELPASSVSTSWTDGPNGPELTLETDACAFFVTANVNSAGTFSDNCLTLLPGQPVTLSFSPRKGASPDIADLQNSLKISHLAQTY